MSEILEVLTNFPNAHYIPGARLVAWHPRGVLDDGLASRIVDFMEVQELIKDEPFDRYIDFAGVSEVHFKISYGFEIAYRRRSRYLGPPVKSALVAKGTLTFGVAQFYEELMSGAQIEVCAFRTRSEAAEWLQVPVNLLCGVP